MKKKRVINEKGDIIEFSDDSLANVVQSCDAFAEYFPNQGSEFQNALQAKLAELARVIPQDKFKDLLTWTLNVRETVAGRPNYLKYYKPWHAIYEDTWAWIMLLIARQMWKSNYLMARMAYKMTMKPASTVLYGTYEDPSLIKFSKKFRNQLWSATDKLRPWVKGSTIGNAQSVELVNESIAWLITHLGGFTHAEGESTDDQDWDEAQYLDWANYIQADQAQSFTRGSFVATGKGGDEDSEYHEMWKQTDQRKWKYSKDDVYVDSAGKEFPGQGWRKNLQFGDDGLVWGEYLTKDKILDGDWDITKPENSSQHGYTLSQYEAPWIALSKADAVNLYKQLPKRSIEGVLTDPNVTHGDFIKNIEAGFVRGERVPFPKQSLYDLCVSTLSMQHASEVDYELGDLYLGADWGGGGRTILWIYQVLNEEYPVFRLINAKRVETNDVHQQYQDAAEWIDAYSVKQAVVDAGGGTSQVQDLETEFGTRCVKFSYLDRPGTPGPKDFNEQRVWRKENRWAYDKTWLMERTRDYINRPFMENTQKINRIVLPGADMEEMDWIIEQFAWERTEKISHHKGNSTLRYYTEDKDRKPDDALHAQNHAIVAWDIGKDKGGKIEFTPVGPADPYKDGYSESQRSY